MPTLQQEKGRRDTLNLRIKPELRGLIDRAAELTGKNRTDFVLSAARRAAEDPAPVTKPANERSRAAERR